MNDLIGSTGLQIGTWRFPLRSPAQAALFAAAILAGPGFVLVGVMGYEGQIAGVGEPAADRLGPGDRVWLRHVKAGELAERLTEYHLINVDAAETPSVPTYCGEGQCFG